MKRILLGVTSLALISNIAYGQCMFLGNFFLTEDKTVLEKLNIKYTERSDSSYEVSFDQMDNLSVQDYCKRISCTQAIAKWVGCQNHVIFQPSVKR